MNRPFLLIGSIDTSEKNTDISAHFSMYDINLWVLKHSNIEWKNALGKSENKHCFYMDLYNEMNVLLENKNI